MSELQIGDIVVLTAGSMRMAVEAIDGDTVSVVWCHEGAIGRDAFNAVLLKKWEHREGDAGGGAGKGKPYRGDREGGGAKRFDDKRFDDKPKPKTGWDGKPREKKYFRKDG
jgi:hypothetical protein